jgi:hypothetical protein
MVIQWMHTSAISLPTSTVVESKKKISHRFSSFLFLPINRLLGPFDSVIASTKAILVIDHQHFLAEHVRTAFASSESSNAQALRSIVPWPMPILHPSWRGLYSQFIQLCSKRIPFSERLERVGRICTGFGVRIVKYNEITRLVRDSDSRFVDPLSGKESNSVWRQL